MLRLILTFILILNAVMHNAFAMDIVIEDKDRVIPGKSDIVIIDDSPELEEDSSVLKENFKSLYRNRKKIKLKPKVEDVINKSTHIADIKNVLVVDANTYGRPIVKMKINEGTTFILPKYEKIKKLVNSNARVFKVLSPPNKKNPNKIVLVAKRTDVEADIDIIGASGKRYFFTLYSLPKYSAQEPSLFVYVGQNPIAAEAFKNKGEEINIDVE